jgi:hypothetical protein
MEAAKQSPMRLYNVAANLPSTIRIINAGSSLLGAFMTRNVNFRMSAAAYYPHHNDKFE